MTIAEPHPPPPAGLSGLLERHEIALCVLFGSRARGDAKADSDVDLGVVRADRRPFTFRELAAAQLELEQILGHRVDLVDLATPDVILRLSVVRDGLVWFVDARERWTDFVGSVLVEHDDIAPWIEACARGVGRAAVRRASA